MSLDCDCARTSRLKKAMARSAALHIRTQLVLTEDVATMDNAAEQYDLIAVLWRLDGFERIPSEIGQTGSIDERVTAPDTERTGRLRNLVAWLRGRVR